MYGGQKVSFIWSQERNQAQNDQEDNLGNDGDRLVGNGKWRAISES